MSNSFPFPFFPLPILFKLWKIIKSIKCVSSYPYQNKGKACFRCFKGPMSRESIKAEWN